MTNSTGPQMGVTLYSFTNEWLTRQFELPGLMREVARRNLGPNIEIIGFQNFKEFPDVSDDFAAQFKDLIAETGLNPVSCAINSDRFLKPGQQPIAHRPRPRPQPEPAQGRRGAAQQPQRQGGAIIETGDARSGAGHIGLHQLKGNVFAAVG